MKTKAVLPMVLAGLLLAGIFILKSFEVNTQAQAQSKPQEVVPELYLPPCEKCGATSIGAECHPNGTFFNSYCAKHCPF